MKATQACALFLLILLLCPLAAQAGTLGPALSYNELLALVRAGARWRRAACLRRFERNR